MAQGNRSAASRTRRTDHELDAFWSGPSVLRPAAAPSQELAFLAVGPAVSLQPVDTYVMLSNAALNYDTQIEFEVTDVFEINLPGASNPDADSSDEETFAAMDAARATAEKEMIARTAHERSARRFVRK